MRSRNIRVWSRWLGIAAGLLLTQLPAQAHAEGPLRIVASVPDLADLARRVGGEGVDVTSLVQGGQDAHFLEARPSFVKALHAADAFVVVGLDLEIGWAPVLLRQSRNTKLQPGGPGYIDASRAIAALDVPSGTLDRSLGDVHAQGNPHYLSDPLNGLRVAELLSDRFSELRPAGTGAFRAGYESFRDELAQRFFGDELVQRFGAAALLERLASGELGSWLGAQSPPAAAGGWFAELQPLGGVAAYQDHALWPYLARRCGLRLAGTLEPKPGIAPTTRHLGELVERASAESVRLLLASPYYDPRHARWLAERTGIRVVALAHQVGAVESAGDYLGTFDVNVQRLRQALEAP